MKKKLTLLILILVFTSGALNAAEIPQEQKPHTLILLTAKKNPKYKKLNILNHGLKYLMRHVLEEHPGLSVAKDEQADIYKKTKKIGMHICIEPISEKRAHIVYRLNIKTYNNGRIVKEEETYYEVPHQNFSLFVVRLAIRLSSDVNYRFNGGVTRYELELLSKALLYRKTNYKLSLRLLTYLIKRQPRYKYIYPLIPEILLSEFEYKKCIVLCKKLLSQTGHSKSDNITSKLKLILSKCYIKAYEPKNALPLLKDCQSYYKKREKKLSLIDTLMLKSKALAMLKKYPLAIKAANKIAVVYKNNFSTALSLVSKAEAKYYQSTDLNQAKTDFEKALEIFKNLKAFKYMLKTIINISSVQIMQKKYLDAAKNIALAEKMIGSKKAPIAILSSIAFSKALISYHAEKTAEALKLFTESLSYSQKTGDTLMQSKSRYYIGVCLLKEKKYKRALKELFTVVKLSRSKGFTQINGWALFYLHYSYHMQNDRVKSLAYLEKSIEVLGDIRHKSLPYLRKRLKLLKDKKKLPEVFIAPKRRRLRALNSQAIRRLQN